MMSYLFKLTFLMGVIFAGATMVYVWRQRANERARLHHDHHYLRRRRRS